MHHWGHPAWHTNMSLLRLLHSFSHLGLQALSCLHTTRPLVPHLSTEVLPSQEWTPHVPIPSSFHTLQEHTPYSHQFFFWCLSDILLLNLKWHFPAYIPHSFFLCLPSTPPLLTRKLYACKVYTTTASATFSLLWSLALPHSMSQHHFCRFSLPHSPDLIASTSKSPSKITIWHWFPFPQLSQIDFC